MWDHKTVFEGVTLAVIDISLKQQLYLTNAKEHSFQLKNLIVMIVTISLLPFILIDKSPYEYESACLLSPPAFAKLCWHAELL